MVRKNIEHLQTIAHAAAGRNDVPEHNLLALIVHAVVVLESAAFARTGDRPPRKAARHFYDIALRVASINTQRVQFQQLAPIILVETALLALLLRVSPDRFPIVQIEQHGRTLRGCKQKIVKLAEQMRPDCLAFVRGNHVSIPTFIEKDVEVVVPKSRLAVRQADGCYSWPAAAYLRSNPWRPLFAGRSTA